MDSYFEKLHVIFRQFQRRNRYVNKASGTDLGLAESRALIELSDDSIVTTPSQLAETLSLSRAELSRIIKTLQERGFILVSFAAKDKRSRHLSLTRKGITATQKLDAAAEASYQKMLENFTREDIFRLKSHLHTLNDGLKAPRTIERPGENPIRSEIRRYSTAQGLFGKISFSDIKINSLQWHIISEIYEAKDELTISKLQLLLGIPGNTLSQSIEKLAQKNLLIKTRAESDRRNVILSLTSAGDQLYRDILRNSAQRFRNALQNVSSDTLADFVELLARSANYSINSEEVIVYPQVKFKRFRSDRERNMLRNFYIKVMLNLDGEFDFQETLFASNSICIGMLLDNKLSGAVEISIQNSKAFVHSLAISCNIEDSYSKNFLEYSFTVLKNEYPSMDLFVDGAHLVSMLKQYKVALRARDNLFLVVINDSVKLSKL